MDLNRVASSFELCVHVVKDNILQAYFHNVPMMHFYKMTMCDFANAS